MEGPRTTDLEAFALYIDRLIDILLIECASFTTQAAQQQARLEQLAQLHHISVDELKGKQDRGGDDDLGSQHSARPEKSMGQRGGPWLLNEVQRLRDKAATMQQQRRAMQQEMAQLEREVAGTRR